MSESINAEDRVSALAEDFLERHRRGLKPSVEAYAVAHPEVADEIRGLFPALLSMEDLKPASGDATGSFDTAAVVARGMRLERLGDFRVLREVGRGGMGVVYEAEQESLGRRVALKVLATHALTDSAQVSRFEREARAAARLHHTNIVPVFGVGQEQGLHYYVMQFIQGLGLDEVITEVKRLRSAAPRAMPMPERAGVPAATGIARSLLTEHFASAPPPADHSDTQSATSAGPGELAPPLAPPAPEPSSQVVLGPAGLSSVSGAAAGYHRSVARIGLQVARALEYAHTQGILHRDVKPSNLLLDVQGTAWVADFGLAKAVEGGNLTHTGDIVGTIRYMAPERFRGKCDARADVYGLGLTMYEMLALRPAFEPTDRQELMRQVMELEPPRLRTLNPAVPRDLDTVVHKAIEKDPPGRYPTAAALGEDLALYLDGKPVRARATGTLERYWKWAKRRPAVAVLLAGFVLAVLTGLAAVTWQWRAAVAARDEAQRTLRMANEAVNTYFTQVSEEQLLNEPGMQPLRKKLLERAIPYYRGFVAQQGDHPSLRAELANAYLRWGSIAYAVGANEEAESALGSAVGEFERLLRSEPVDVGARIGLAKAHQALAQEWIFNRNQPRPGRREAEQAVAAWDAVLAARPKDVTCRRMLGRCHDLIGQTWANVGALKEAVPSSHKAIEILTDVVREAPGEIEAMTRLAVAYSNLGLTLWVGGRWTEAEQALSGSLDLTESRFRIDSSSLTVRIDLARAQINRGKIRLFNGAVRDAENDLTKGRRLCRELIRDNPRVPEYRYFLGEAGDYLGKVHAAQGQTMLARQILDEGLANEQELLRQSPNYRDTNLSVTEYYCTLGSLEGECGRIGSASHWCERALSGLSEMQKKDPDNPILPTDLFEAQVVSLAVDIKAGGSPAAESTAAERTAAVHRLVQQRRQQADNDPTNLWAGTDTVSGYLALADGALTWRGPTAALALLNEATAVLEPRLQAAPANLRLRSLAVRLGTARGEIRRRLGQNEEAAEAAKQALVIAEPLAVAEPAYLYDLARARTLQARLDPLVSGPAAAAVSALRRAVEHGYDNAYKLEHDDHLALLRVREDFRALIRLVKDLEDTPAGRNEAPEP
jgi:serine/threonine-protein kinase